MPLFKDQTGRTVELTRTPERIISLVPSQTELLYHLGLDDEVIGITRFCIHPEHWYRNKTRVGGTKQLHPGRIRALRPDLILANREENVREQVEELAKDHPVWISAVHDLSSALEMILSVGEMTGKQETARQTEGRIRKGFEELHAPRRRPRACYLIWRDPWMTVGGDTFIHSMMEQAGFDNLFACHKRYPEIDLSLLPSLGCELLLLSSEPFPFAEKHVTELSQLVSGIPVVLVDGQMFSWYGSRLIKAPAYFAQLRLSLGHAARFG